MTDDDYKKHFHLIHRGLNDVSWWFFKKAQAELAHPADALATFDLNVRQCS